MAGAAAAPGVDPRCYVVPSPGASPVPPSPFLGDPNRTPPPTPVPPYDCPSPFPTTLQTPTPAPEPPSLQAAAAVLEDVGTGQVLFGRRADQRHPIASLTKLMTTQVVLAHSKLSDPVTVDRNAAGLEGAGMGLVAGEVDSVRDLMIGMLLASANDAAEALADHVSGSPAKFVRLMNARAHQLGMTRSHFASPSGLNDRGLSTARDVATMARAALRYAVVRRIVDTKFADLPAPNGGERRVQNRNVLLWLYPGATGVKTGFTSKAGWCLVAEAHQGGRTLLAVVLGDPDQQASFNDAAALLSYGLDEFVPVTVATAGQILGTLTLRDRVVTVATRVGLRLLVRRDRVHHLRWRVVARAGLRLPVTAGEVVATATLSDGLSTIARTVGVAVSAVAAPPPPPGSLVAPFARPVRSWGAVQRNSLRLLGGFLQATLHAFL